MILWGKRAEALNKILSKGRAICVEGRIQHRQWEDKEGNRRWTTEIVARQVKFLSSRNEEGGARRGTAGPPPHDDTDAGFDPGFSDDQIPF